MPPENRITIGVLRHKYNQEGLLPQADIYRLVEIANKTWEESRDQSDSEMKDVWKRLQDRLHPQNDARTIHTDTESSTKLSNQEKAQESDKIVTAKVLGLEYRKGNGREVVQFTRSGVKRKNPDKPLGRMVRGGHGSYLFVDPSHYILTVEVDGEKQEIWTERDFRLGMGIRALDQKTRELIESEAPETVNTIKAVGQRGTNYYKLTEDTVLDWIDRLKDNQKE